MRFEWLPKKKKKGEYIPAYPVRPALSRSVLWIVMLVYIYIRNWRNERGATSDDYYNHYKLPSADNELNNSHKGAGAG